MASRNMFSSAQKTLAMQEDVAPSQEEVFENLSRIAATHAATRIRDASMRLLTIWFENISNKMIKALDVPARHLRDFQQEPNEDSLTNFMDSFIAAQEVIKEQLVAQDDENDSGNSSSSNKPSANLGPKGNPFEINNRLLELFVLTITDAIGSMKVAIKDEEDMSRKEDKRADEAFERERDQQVQNENIQSVHHEYTQRNAPIGATPNREWNQLGDDSHTPVVSHPTHFDARNLVAAGAPHYAPSNVTSDRLSLLRPPTPSASVADTQQRSVSSHLLAKRQKRFGVSGKVGIHGADEEVAVPFTRQHSEVNPSSRSSSAVTPRYATTALANHNIFALPAQPQKLTGRAHPQLSQQHESSISLAPSGTVTPRLNHHTVAPYASSAAPADSPPAGRALTGRRNNDSTQMSVLFGGAPNPTQRNTPMRQESSQGLGRHNQQPETAKQAQLRHEISVMESQLFAARNAGGDVSSKMYAINKKISVLKSELIKEDREANEVISMNREREAQRYAVDEKRKIFHR